MINPDEKDRQLYADRVLAELDQLSKLLQHDLTLDDIAHRMAWDEAELRRVLKQMKVDHAGLHQPMLKNRKRKGAKARQARLPTPPRRNGNGN